MANLETAQSFFKFLIAQDTEGLSSIISDGFSHRLLPATTGLPASNKDQFLAMVTKTASIMVSSKFDPHQEIIEAGDSVVVHTSGTGTLKNGYTFQNEFVYIFRFESGKISSIKEFTDTKVFEKMAAEMGLSG
ncbi:hypothetical protein C8R43DRAFT_1241142 [Mycena crocata]|nr:hypothetical protein C8R43DRAFT_1241142 [Mycena crocata]